MINKATKLLMLESHIELLVHLHDEIGILPAQQTGVSTPRKPPQYLISRNEVMEKLDETYRFVKNSITTLKKQLKKEESPIIMP